ncbi:MAG: ATP-binding protein, partial [Methylomonas sp.]
HLRQKIERLKVLHDPRVTTPLALESDGPIQFIVQPWFAGQPLNRWRQEQIQLNLKDFFTLACTLADILLAVHDAGITHGGIKPHNILVQAGTLTLRLTDFITPLDIRDVSHFIYDPEFVRHTLAYTSPEQTGRINYRVDFSTDLYSLGVVFYELLAGKLPFFSSDPLELIHSHLAEEAPKVNIINSEIPEVLAEIVAKLMIKQPEKRYQSSAGLLADLMRCQKEYVATGNIAFFALGQHDRSRRVIFISKMVGRQQESQLIQQQYQEVIGGSFRSVLISGLSGIGKTRLIQELQKPLVKNRGYFTSGKFDQYEKNIPYSSLIQALRNLIRTFLTESDVQVRQWQTKILDAVENNGSVISDVVPELEFIIGPQPEVPHLPPVEARNRFNNLFGRFVACLASEDNPLVLFIDDLQWCDSATFDFLQNLFANHHEHPFLFFIGAYRHNEVDSAHPLSKLMRNVQERNGPLVEFRLEALTDADCHEMVAYILDSSLESTATLAEFIAHLTEGNPLFVSESLAWLYNENLLMTDAEQHWQWDIKRIHDTQMPASVVELFSSKVRKLPNNALHILNHCACMGNRFTATDLVLILEISMEQLFEDLKPVLNLGMLLENKTDLQFVHDRVQEAVLRQVDTAARPAIHWRIGNRLLGAVAQNSDLEELDNLFTIAAHLNRGRPENMDADLSYKLATINFHAGNKALDALAADAANDFFLKAHDYLPQDCWERAYDLTYRIHQRLAKTDLMCGRYEHSEVLLNHLIEHAVSDLDKAEALAEQTTSLSSFGNFIKAIETANRGLAYFNKSIPEDPEIARQRMQALMAQIKQQGDVWNTILHMPFTQERKSKIELAFYSELIPDLYMCGLVPQLYLSAAQSTLHCLEGGMDESVI